MASIEVPCVKLTGMTHTLAFDYDFWQRIMDALPPEAQALEARIAAACEAESDAQAITLTLSEAEFAVLAPLLESKPT